MTKLELAEYAAAKTGCTTKEAANVLDAAFDGIRKAVAAGEEVTLRGFGTFKAKHKAAKPARNISTGEAITIPAHRAPVFKAYPAFEEAVK